MKKYKTAEDFYQDEQQYKEAFKVLRKVLLAAKLEETVKWGVPVYTHKGKNVAGVTGFKDYFGIWFYQGAMLKDPYKVLTSASDETKAMRRIYYRDAKEIDTKVLREYLQEAILNTEAGREIRADRTKALEIPEELTALFSKETALKEQFEALSLTKRREYVEFIATAKREETRRTRLEKIRPMILEGKGLNDKYR